MRGQSEAAVNDYSQHTKWTLYSIIDGANLAQFEVREGCFKMD